MFFDLLEKRWVRILIALKSKLLVFLCEEKLARAMSKNDRILMQFCRKYSNVKTNMLGSFFE